MGSHGGAPELPAAASPLVEGSPPPPSYQSDRVKAMKKVDPVDIQWERVNLRVPAKGGAKKSVLTGVSGQLRSGCITAIMGPTGCGKTSLLNVLSGRVQYVAGAKLTGRLLTNGAPRDEAAFADMSAYVTQDDQLYGQLTVGETLTLAAHFSLGSSMPQRELEAYVNSVINDLGLKKARDTVIGDEMTKGVSGGERKRVSIGVELISNPSVLFLDEPTSGLDAFQALSVMQAMKELAGAGRTVVAVIHQPRSSIFSMLDDLVLLSEGRTVYVGPAKDAHAWFARLGFVCPAGAAPSDYFLDVVAKDYRTPALEALSQRRIDRLTAAFALEHQSASTPQDKQQRATAAMATATGAGHSSPLARAAQQLARRSTQSYGSSWWTQLRYLAWRNAAVMARNKIGRVASTAVPLILSIVLGLIWSNRDVDPQKALMDKIGLLFMVCINMGFGGMNETLQTFPIEKRTVQKERASGYYSISAYYVSKVLTALPYAMIGPALFCCILYPAAGLRAGADHFFIFMGVVLAETLCAGALGMLISSMASDPEIANAMAPAFNIILTIFNGVLISIKDLPTGSGWLAEIGYNRWTFEAFALNEFRGRSYDCGSIADPAACIRTGDQMLNLYGYGDGNIGRCVGYLVLIALVTHTLAFLNLWRASPRFLRMEEDKAAAAVDETATAITAVPALLTAAEEQSALDEVTSRGTGASHMPPVPAVDLAWRGLEMLVPVKGQGEGKGKGSKAVLDKVSGEVKSGTLTAIMGPSGSGKSSLLNVLAGRVLQVKGGTLRGTLLTNGHPRDAAAFKKISAFVIQDDLLFGHLTVHETLLLAAHFALGSGATAKEKEALVGSVIADLGLAKTISTIIGDERARGVSGGERKRVSIGVELIANPAVIFLDEPTSGLDAFQALSVMSTMQKLAQNGRTVVASIHQPRSAIYELLDKLVLVSEGRTIFLGEAKDAARFFADHGFVCPPFFNQADYYLDTISMDYRTPELEAATRARIQTLADAWATEEDQKGAGPDENEDVAEDEEVGNPAGAAALIKNKPSCRDLAAASALGNPKHRAGWFSNLWHLTRRAFKSAYRNTFAIGLRTVMNVFFALLFSAIWHEVRHDQKGIQSLIGLCFMVATNISFGNLQAVINVFPVEKAVVIKEQASSSYKLSAYFLSKFLSEIPLNLLGPTIFGTLIFWIIDFTHTLPKYGLFLAICGVMALASVGMGILISTLAPSVQVAASIGVLPNIIFLIFAGVLINLDSLPAGAKWVASISPIQWCVRALALNEFTGATFSCEPNQRCLATGEEVLQLYSWDGSTIGMCLLYLACIMAAFLLLGYLVLRRSLPRYMTVAEPNKTKAATTAEAPAVAVVAVVS